jgi:nucleotide-binding universal stress UspA family protein
MKKDIRNEGLFSETIITAGQFPYSRALILQSMLSGKGIDCFLVTEPEMQSPEGNVEIRVRESDYAKALRLIESATFETGAVKEKALKNIRAVRRILVPVDFSNHSLKACRFAITMAKQLKAEVTLLHVFYNPAIDVTPYNDHHAYQVKLSELLHEIELASRENMEKLVNDMKVWSRKARMGNIKIVSAFANGRAVTEILEYSFRYSPSVIILGTRGLSKNKQEVFGEVTYDIISQAKFPVLAIPDSPVESIKDIKRILYATDFDLFDFSALNRLISMTSAFGTKIHCVHVSIGTKKTWEQAKFHQLQRHLAGQYHDQHITFNHLIGDNFLNSLETYIRDHHIDAIALITHKREFPSNLFERSSSRKIFSRIKKPLLVFHASAMA